MSLCTIAQVKAVLGIGSADTEHDVVLDTLILSVADELARVTGREVANAARFEKSDVTELLSPPRSTHVLYLVARPIVTVTTLKEALYGDFAASDALVENTDYQVMRDYGKLIRIGTWLAGDMTVSAAYTGGYTFCLPWEAGEAYAADDVVSHNGAVYTCTDALEVSSTAPPADTDHWGAEAYERPVPWVVIDKAIKQVAFYFRRLDQLGVLSAGVAGASFTRYAKDGLLPDVAATMATFRRRMGP